MTKPLSIMVNTGATPEVRFETSGHTAMPIAWFRSREQLDQEIQVILSGRVTKLNRIISFAPTRHIYGYVFAHHLPSYINVKVTEAWRNMLDVPKLKGNEHLLIVATPGCWRIIWEMARYTSPKQWIVLHSGGLLPKLCQPWIEYLLKQGARVIEILGSTETGAIATREANTDYTKPWQLVSDVELAGDYSSGTSRLSISSPRIGRRFDLVVAPHTWTLPDLVDVMPDRRHFTYVGRESRFVKVDGRRCNLELIELRIRTLESIADVACIARRSAVRGEHYDIYLVVRPDSYIGNDLISCIKNGCEGLPLPHEVKLVSKIPRNRLGKVLFGEMTTYAI